MHSNEEELPEGGSPTSEEALIPPEDVARLFNKSTRWLKDQARRGRIPHRRVGRSYAFAAEDIAAMREQFGRPVGSGAGSRRGRA
ncbi:helix-turn-helix domain-containing protein [Actinomadura sp. K4S16]|uniref:helix-turn-helix domain-containing protein n=1 Tax=Actinomadura sp. K4S16 TaxID=1316147 RepID=UPI0011EEC9D9|nr:helix-turn-helix domain-containing protein [Actinomadura sp. K4S16]